MQKKIIENCQKQEDDLWVNGYFMIVTMVTIQYMIDFFFGVIWHWNRISWFFWNCNMACGATIKEDLYVNIENFAMKTSRNEEKLSLLW